MNNTIQIDPPLVTTSFSFHQVCQNKLTCPWILILEKQKHPISTWCHLGTEHHNCSPCSKCVSINTINTSLSGFNNACTIEVWDSHRGDQEQYETLCSPLQLYQHYKATCCHHLLHEHRGGSRKSLQNFNKFIPDYRVSHIPEDNYHHKTHITIFNTYQHIFSQLLICHSPSFWQWNISVKLHWPHSFKILGHGEQGGTNSNWRDVNNNQLFHQFWLKTQSFTRNINQLKIISLKILHTL